MASPMPKWLISAAMPRPAARPASGPIHDRLGAAAGAAAAAGVACVGAAWAGVAGLAGTSGAVLAGMLRCRPVDWPPPSRLASEMEGSVAPTRATTTAAMSQFFMLSNPQESGVNQVR